MKPVIVCALSTLLLTACGKPGTADTPPAAAPSAVDPNAFTPEIAKQLIEGVVTQNTVEAHTTYARVPCTDYFAIDDVTVSDTQSNGPDAQAVALVRVHAINAIPAGSKEDTQCWRPPGGWNDGWTAGEAVTNQFTYHFLKWDSGWKIQRY